MLFLPYYRQYTKWWGDGIKKANKELKRNNNITIISLDFTNYFHSIQFDFEELFSWYDKNRKGCDIREDNLTKILQKIHETYHKEAIKYDVNIFSKGVDGSLPVTLLSSFILANWYLNEFDRYITNTYSENILYYARYVDDIMIVCKDLSKKVGVRDIIEDKLPGLLKRNNNDSKDVFNVKISENKYLTVQQEKVFVYMFNCQLPVHSIDKFEKEQKVRSSEFRFCTEEDINTISLEDVQLIDAMENIDGDKSKFKKIDDNKYLLSVYFTKLATLIINNNENINKKKDELIKVSKTFTNQTLLKNYVLWEKILTVFALAGLNRMSLVMKNRMNNLLKRINVDKELNTKILENIKHTLKLHVELSYEMAEGVAKKKKKNIFIETYLLRKHYFRLPMQELIIGSNITDVLTPQKEENYYDLTQLDYKWFPYYVKYYEIFLVLYLSGKEPNLSEEALKKYLVINHINSNSKPIIEHLLLSENKKDGNIITRTFDFRDFSETKDKINVAVTEMNINEKIISLKKEKKKIISEHEEKLRKILDNIRGLPNVDVVVLPELALSQKSLFSYCRESSTYQYAFISGINYRIKENYVYNDIITCIPLKLCNIKDAMPIIRTKNYYAPVEEKYIKKRKLLIPSFEKCYFKINFRGHWFTTYYCFELTNIRDRALFFSEVDVIYAPVFNKDTYYYNNIAESYARDMHCYFVQCNVADYGDTRVTQPTKQETMNIMRVKGGVTEENDVLVLTCKLDIKALRESQKTEHTSSDKFKPLPPEFDIEKKQNSESK